MIIPIRCLTCGKVIADKYNTYLQKVEENKIKNNLNLDESILYINSKEIKKTIEGEILDELGLKRYCCRRMFLGHTDISTNI